MAKLGLIPCDDDADRRMAFLGIPNQLLDVRLSDHSFVLIVDENPWLQRSTAGVTKCQQVIAVLGKFVADIDARPRLHFVREIHFLTFAYAGDLGHLGFQFVIPLLKFHYFPQGVFDPAIGVLNFVRLLLLRSPESVEFILVAFRNVGSTPREFGLKPRPPILIVLIVLVLEQAKGLFGTQLRNSGEVFNPEAIQGLGSL